MIGDRKGPLLAIALTLLAAGALAWASFRPEPENLPEGTTRSYAGDGSAALLLWVQSLGEKPQPLTSLSPEDSSPIESLLFVIQPQTYVSLAEYARFQLPASHGGTVVVAGDSVWTTALLARLGVTLENVPTQPDVERADGSGTLGLSLHARLHAEGASPLLVASNGDWLALRKPLDSGTLIVIAGAAPLSNEGLRDEETARFVYEEVLSTPAKGATIGFDEMNYVFPSQAPTTASPSPDLGQLLFTSPGGRAFLYAALLLVLYLFLSSRRLGPALAPLQAGRAERSLFEYVRTLAGLYRRARQLAYLRRFYRQRYERQLAHAPGATRAASQQEDLDGVLRIIDQASSERALLKAVNQAEDLVRQVPWRGDRLSRA